MKYTKRRRDGCERPGRSDLHVHRGGGRRGARVRRDEHAQPVRQLELRVLAVLFGLALAFDGSREPQNRSAGALERISCGQLGGLRCARSLCERPSAGRRITEVAFAWAQVSSIDAVPAVGDWVEAEEGASLRANAQLSPAQQHPEWPKRWEAIAHIGALAMIRTVNTRRARHIRWEVQGELREQYARPCSWQAQTRRERQRHSDAA